MLLYDYTGSYVYLLPTGFVVKTWLLQVVCTWILFSVISDRDSKVCYVKQLNRTQPLTLVLLMKIRKEEL